MRSEWLKALKSFACGIDWLSVCLFVFVALLRRFVVAIAVVGVVFVFVLFSAGNFVCF